MTVIANATIAHQSLPGLQHQTLANADHGLAHLSLWRQTMAPGAATPPHRHDCEEVVLIESGSGELHLACPCVGGVAVAAHHAPGLALGH